MEIKYSNFSKLNRVVTMWLFILATFTALFLTRRVECSEESTLHCHSELKEVLGKVRTLPEGDELILKVLEQGPLYIELNTHLSNQFDGYWSAYDRTIYISKTPESSDCFLITALVFELHNALRTADLEEMYDLATNQAIEREEFIKAVEYIEYENACATSMLLDQGAAYDIFPCDCYWKLSDNFPEHLNIQQNGGHSASIGRMYDQLLVE